eukprot:scaffold72208_cov31-Tisochrysis_lutea.AAC.1
MPLRRSPYALQFTVACSYLHPLIRCRCPMPALVSSESEIDCDKVSGREQSGCRLPSTTANRALTLNESKNKEFRRLGRKRDKMHGVRCTNEQSCAHGLEQPCSRLTIQGSCTIASDVFIYGQLKEAMHRGKRQQRRMTQSLRRR